MARLSRDQAIALVRTPKHAEHIRQAREQEDKLVFHCEPVLDQNLLPQSAKNKFFSFVDSLLPKDKATRFRQLLSLPVDTTESTKAIFDELGKFLDAQDRYIHFSFSNEQIEADFAEFSAGLADSSFWREYALPALRTRINSFLVVDVAARQSTFRPEPYYYFVGIEQVKDVELHKDTGVVEYLIFEREDKSFVVIDDEFYRVVQKDEAQDRDWKIVVENPHTVYSAEGQQVEGLGYCPATSFYAEPIYNSGRVNNRGPLTDVLGKLDWLLFWRTSKKYLDTYGAWPIIVSYKSACNYKDSAGNGCHEGFVNSTTWDATTNTSIPCTIACPACAKKGVMGPGSWWEVDAPASKDEPDLLANPVKIVEISNDKLEYGVSEILRLEDEIYLDCVGYDGDTIGKQAVNETQVSANFESKSSVLDGIKAQFERAHKFVMDTVCRIRYGQYFTGSIVNYGSEYFLRTAADITKEYDEARKAGMPGYYLAILRNQISRTRFKNNPQQMQRDEILSQLEPYADLTYDQLTALQIAQTDPTGYIIKLNFYSFIQRFEREQIDVVTFGSLLPFGSKISLINQKLKTYANEQATVPRTEPAGNGGSASAAN